MIPTLRRCCISALDAVLMLVWLGHSLVIAALPVAFALLAIRNWMGGLPDLSLGVWLMLAPAIYVAWLLVVLAIFAIDIQIHVGYLRYRKPIRVTDRGRLYEWLIFYASLFAYNRMRFVLALPLVNSLQATPLLRHLVLLTYAPSTHLGERSLIVGWLFDPDITVVGDGAIVGTYAAVVGHSITTLPDGTTVIVTAPIQIGDRAVIGGGAHIDIGVRIGEDAMVEPMSFVPAYSTIGPGEVWGGNPARFLRMRQLEPLQDGPADRSPLKQHETSPPVVDGETERVLREIVATALQSPVETVTPDFHSRDNSAWDSLAQLGMAADLQRRFGVTLTQQESMRLRSLDDLRAIVRRHKAAGTTRA